MNNDPFAPAANPNQPEFLPDEAVQLAESAFCEELAKLVERAGSAGTTRRLID